MTPFPNTSVSPRAKTPLATEVRLLPPSRPPGHSRQPEPLLFSFVLLCCFAIRVTQPLLGLSLLLCDLGRSVTAPLLA